MKTDEGYRKRCVRHTLPGHPHELTFSCYKNQKFISDEQTCHWLAESISIAREKHNFDVWAYVFMPDHVHLLIFPKTETYSISKLLISIKQPVSRKIIFHLRKNAPEKLHRLETGQIHTPYRFWQDGGGYDRIITNPNILRKMVKYIHNNPVRKRLANSVLDWQWSSARFWAEGIAGVIPVDLSLFPM